MLSNRCFGPFVALLFVSAIALQQPMLTHKSKLVTNLLEFHKNLTQLESITENETDICEWLAHSLESQGYTVEKQNVTAQPLRFNILAWPGANRDAKVLLSSHIDTVPPFYPYKYDGHSIAGRGSVDAKASVAAQLIAVNELLLADSASADDLSVLFVVGEETGGDGMRKANDLDLKPDAIIFGEPTDGKLVSGHKGLLGLNVTAKGKSAHSGYPWLGRSANEVLLKALTAITDLAERLPESNKYGNTTFNIGQIQGGVAANVVAETASAQVAIRIASGTPAKLQAQIKEAVYTSTQSFLKDGLRPEDIIEMSYNSKGYPPVDLDHDIPGFKVMTVNYGTDVPNFELRGTDQKRYLYGPGSIFVAHSDHEALSKGTLQHAVEDYKGIILHILDNHESRLHPEH